MRTHYSITIENTRKKAIRLISLFMILAVGLLLIYLGYLKGVNKSVVYGGVVVVFIVIDHFKHSEKFNLKTMAIVLQLVGWLSLGYWWIGAAIILLSIFEHEALRNRVIAFAAEGVKLKGMFGSSHKWYELNNVLVKDGMITLDFKNNKIIQAEILQEETDIENETEFNWFCQEQLKKNELAVKA
jgi:hypothetical protein